MLRLIRLLVNNRQFVTRFRWYLSGSCQSSFHRVPSRSQSRVLAPCVSSRLHSLSRLPQPATNASGNVVLEGAFHSCPRLVSLFYETQWFFR